MLVDNIDVAYNRGDDDAKWRVTSKNTSRPIWLQSIEDRKTKIL